MVIFVMYGDGENATAVGRGQLPLKAIVGSGVRPAATAGALVDADWLATAIVVGSSATGAQGSDVCTGAAGGGAGALLVGCPGCPPTSTGVDVGVGAGVGQGASVGDAAL